MVTDRAEELSLAFPAVSDALAVIEWAPSERDELVIDQFPDPSAVPVPIDVLPALKISTLSLAWAPVPENVGVLSEVSSSLFVLLSLPLSKSGADGADGALVSIVTDKADEPSPVAPAVSDAFAVIEWAPSDRDELVIDQFPDPSAVPVPIDVLPALKISMFTFASDVPVNVGVSSFVRLSAADDPRSLPLSRSGVDGADGGAVSIVTDSADEAELALPAKSYALAVIE